MGAEGHDVRAETEDLAAAVAALCLRLYLVVGLVLCSSPRGESNS
jgi:hypothetical protein